MRVPLPLTFVAVVALAACGGSSPTVAPTTAAPGTPAGATATSAGASATSGGGGSADAISCNDGENGAEVSIIDFGFQPATVTADAGRVVHWTNTGSATHTVTFDNGKDCGSLAAGDSLHVLFSAAGTYPYHCTIHSSMKGTVTVNS